MRLLYTGTGPVSFMTCDVGEVQPGATFEVPDEAAPGFLARRDVEAAPEDPPPVEDPPSLPSRSRKKTPPAAVPEPQPAAAPGDAPITEEDSRGLSDDH